MPLKKRKLTHAAISKAVREVRTERSRMTEAERDAAIERLLRHARSGGAIIQRRQRLPA